MQPAGWLPGRPCHSPAPHLSPPACRTIHLGTECWLLVASRSAAYARQLAAAGHWHVAAGRLAHVSRQLSFLGEHMLMLTSMNLRDYLQLKVELEGTSGAGSTQVGGLVAGVAWGDLGVEVEHAVGGQVVLVSSRSQQHLLSTCTFTGLPPAHMAPP